MAEESLPMSLIQNSIKTVSKTHFCEIWMHRFTKKRENLTEIKNKNNYTCANNNLVKNGLK